MRTTEDRAVEESFDDDTMSEVEESFDDNTMSEAKDIFDTPGLKYLQMKKSFLKKARNFQFWGSNGSSQRVIALDTMLRYCQESMRLRDRLWNDDALTLCDVEVSKDILLDIKNFVLKKQAFTVPRVIREKLTSALEKSPEHRPRGAVEDMIAELKDLHDTSLHQYYRNERSRMDDFDQDSSELRWLRKRVYDEVNVRWDIQDYDHKVEQFLKRFSDILTPEEVDVWKQKRLDTIHFAEKSLGGSQSCDFLFPLHALDCSDDEKDEAEEETVLVENEKKSLPPVVNELEAEESLITESEAETSLEFLLANLPSVPDNDESFDNQSTVDQEIEARLLKIKLFRRTFCSEPRCETKPQKVIPLVVAQTSEPKGEEAAKTDPSLSNINTEEAIKFNEWYLEKIGAVSHFDEKLHFSSSFSDVTSQFMPCLKPAQFTQKLAPESDDMDEEMVDAVSETKSYYNNLVERSSVHAISNTMTTNLLVMFLTILKFIHVTQPKLSYVPVVFPTQTQPSRPLLSPSDTPVPVYSNSCAPAVAPVKSWKAVSAMTSLKQVSSDLVRTCLSWSGGRLGEIVANKKTAVGLKLIQVGEMLLA